MRRTLAALLIALAALVCAATAPGGVAPALAQAASEPTADVSRALDAANEQLKEARAIFARTDLAEGDFARLRELSAQAGAAAAQALESVRPRAEAAKARLDQLGPAVDPKTGAAENPDTAATRADLTQRFNELDALAKRARVIALEADQTAAQTAERRREIFARALFTRSDSILSPSLWATAFGDLPREGRALATLASDWAGAIAARAKTWQVAALVAYIAIVLMAAPPLRRRVRAALDGRRRAGAKPDDLHRYLFALWTTLVIAAAPIVAVAGALALLDLFDLSTPRFAPIPRSLADATARLSITAGLILGMLAPLQPAWRLLDLSDPMVDRILWLGMRIAAALSLMKILEATLDVAAAPLAVTVVVRGVISLAVALMLARGLSTIARLRISPDDDRYAALRALGWIAAVLIGVAALAGYVAFAAFLVQQINWVAGVVSFTYILLGIVHAGTGRLFDANGWLAGGLSSAAGLKPQSLPQFAVATSGVVSLLLIVGAALLIVAPWGLESQDMVAYVVASLGAVKIGDVQLSLSTIVGAFVTFLILWALMRAAQRWLTRSFLPSTQIDGGLRDAIGASFGYVGVMIAALAGLAQLGVGFDKLAIVAGALSVGIGFGLQSIVSNFVSGLIVLWERAIRVGDWIAVGGEEGYVRRINVRSTEIETFDRVLVSMPNSNLVSGVVKNWVRGDKGGRVKLRVSTRRDADPETVRDLLARIAKTHEAVQGIPAPSVNFLGFDQVALHFELIAHIADVEMAVRVKSDLTFAVFAALREEKLLTPVAEAAGGLAATLEAARGQGEVS